MSATHPSAFCLHPFLRTASHLLVLHSMNLNQDDIATVRNRLRDEITERECLLAAVELFEKYAASGQAPRSINLGGLLSTLVPDRACIELKELPALPTPPVPVALPPPPPVERYVHPDLKPLINYSHGRNGRVVWWAIERMTEDYSLHDVAALLEREGAPLANPHISVVLTRLKNRGEIEEVKQSAGPHPAVFRKPENPIPLAPAVEDVASDTPTSLSPVTVS
jgi:hypothetical protein